jgi:hypothetical protein
VNVLWGVVVLAVASAAAIEGMLRCRRRAPVGGYFADGDRAAGVFGVLATGFSVLLGFLIFLSFESFDASRSGAEDEAMTLVQQVETAQLLPPAEGAELTGSLICYGRWVVFEEWPAMEDGSLGDALNPWGVELFRITERTEPESASEQAAFGKWLDQTTDRETARQDRIHGAAGVMPAPLWIALFFISGVVVVYLLAFADSGERAAIQALYAGSVVSVIVAMLLLLAFLDNPVSGGVGGLEPNAMERALILIDESVEASDTRVVLPCDESGRP